MLSDIITFIFNFLMGIIMMGVKILLLPIDLLIQNTMPEFSDTLTAIANLFTLIGTGIGWAIAAAGLPFAVVALVVTYTIFKLTLPLQIWFIKLGLKWYRTLKP